MGAIAAASRALQVLRRNPVLFAAGVLIALLSVPSYLVQVTDIPLLSTVWGGITFFVSPFLTVGIIAMCEDGLRGTTTLARLVDAGKEYYVTALLSTLLIAVVVGTIAVVGAILLFILGMLVFGISASSGVDPTSGAMLGLALLGIPYVLFLAAVALFFQFVYQAIVMDDLGPVAAVRQSYRTVRTNLIGAIGVSTLAFLLSGVLAGGPVLLATFSLGSPSMPSMDLVPLSRTAALLIIFGWGTLTSVLITAFNNSMLVAFYDAHAPTPTA